MAYPYNPYGGYYGQPAPDQLAQLRQQQYQQPQMQQMSAQQSQGGMVWVNSEAEAMNFMVAPNCAVPIWDANRPVVYLKQADASGRPSFKVFDLVERTGRQEPAAAENNPGKEYVTWDKFEALERKLDAAIKNMEADDE